MTERTVDFGASDAPMSDEELQKAPGKLMHIPTTLGAVVIAYNVPGVSTLKLSPDVVAGIFLGNISQVERRQDQEAKPGRQAAR